MKGDVKRQVFIYDWRQRIGFDIPPQTTTVGSNEFISAKAVHVFRYNPKMCQLDLVESPPLSPFRSSNA